MFSLNPENIFVRVFIKNGEIKIRLKPLFHNGASTDFVITQSQIGHIFSSVITRKKCFCFGRTQSP